VSSPLRRAQEMALPTVRTLNVSRFSSSEFLVPGSNPQQLVQEINNSDLESTLLVGHEPFLGEFLSYLVTGTTGFKVEFKKSTLALVETPLPVQKGRGQLKWIVTFEHMEMIT